MIVLETQRLLLRQFHSFDQPALQAIFGDPEVMRYGPGVQTAEWIAAWLRDTLDGYQRLGFGPWAVVDKATSSLIGYCGLFYYPDLAGQPEVEIGYRLARPAWGKGCATEAAQAVRDYAFNVLTLERLVALIDPDNTASLRVAEKIGMQYEQDVMLEGYTYPDRLYTLQKPIPS